MFLNVIAILACAVVLFFASRIVYRQVTIIAGALRVPVFLVSLLLVAFSTSIPELFVGISSALEGMPAFSLGDIFGSNIVNLTFIAGLVILVGRKNITLSRDMSDRLMLGTFAVASMPVFLLVDGTLSRIDGVLLLALYALYIYFAIISRSRKLAEKYEATSLLKPVLLFFVGVALLIVASEIMIKSASVISASLQVAPFVVGVFALAISTSVPELVFGLRVALQRQPELSLGDLLGSCAVNATAILGIVALIHPIVPSELAAALFTGFFGIVIYIAFFLIAGRGTIKAPHGAILLMLYLLFVFFHFAL